jgi:O-antigen ligase
MLIVFYFRIKLSTLGILAAIALVIASFYQTEIYFKLKANKRTSNTNIEQHIESMYNISTDASNTERINRWHSALRMFYERPVLGWGPGTYMFQYAPFQLSTERTVISTNFGTLGNAHSEYVGPLAESGVLGILSIISILIVSLYKSMQLIYYGKNRLVRALATAMILGLITYFVHGFLNDYLDTDKASIPFWAFMAILTALDLYYNKPENTPDELPAN